MLLKDKGPTQQENISSFFYLPDFMINSLNFMIKFIKLNAFECGHVISGLGLIILVEGMRFSYEGKHFPFLSQSTSSDANFCIMPIGEVEAS
jgi:hypothetical protein